MDIKFPVFIILCQYVTLCNTWMSEEWHKIKNIQFYFNIQLKHSFLIILNLSSFQLDLVSMLAKNPGATTHLLSLVPSHVSLLPAFLYKW